MPYTPEHKQRTRAKIVDSARVLFNRHGFDQVSIDDVMKSAGLTRVVHDARREHGAHLPRRAAR